MFVLTMDDNYLCYAAGGHAGMLGRNVHSFKQRRSFAASLLPW